MGKELTGHTIEKKNETNVKCDFRTLVFLLFWTHRMARQDGHMARKGLEPLVDFKQNFACQGKSSHGKEACSNQLSAISHGETKQQPHGIISHDETDLCHAMNCEIGPWTNFFLAK